MNRPFSQIDLEREGDLVFARLRSNRLDENGIYLLGNELTQLIEQEGCRKLVLSLGGQSLQCLYSVFLSKLVMVHRLLHEQGGALILCEVAPEVQAIFEACKLKDYLHFAPDRAGALAALDQKKMA